MKTVVELFASKVHVTFARNSVRCGDELILAAVLRVVDDSTHALSSPSVPDADYARALMACEALGGRIVTYDGPPESVPGTVH